MFFVWMWCVNSVFVCVYVCGEYEILLLVIKNGRSIGCQDSVNVYFLMLYIVCRIFIKRGMYPWVKANNCENATIKSLRVEVQVCGGIFLSEFDLYFQLISVNARPTKVGYCSFVVSDICQKIVYLVRTTPVPAICADSFNSILIRRPPSTLIKYNLRLKVATLFDERISKVILAVTFLMRTHNNDRQDCQMTT